jgi:hypothetical protein
MPREFTSQKALQDQAEQDRQPLRIGRDCHPSAAALARSIRDRGCAHAPWSAALGAADPEGGPESPVGG